MSHRQAKGVRQGPVPLNSPQNHEPMTPLSTIPQEHTRTTHDLHPGEILLDLTREYDGLGSTRISQVTHKQQTTIRKPIECAPEASSGGREWAEMTGVLFQLLT